MISAWRGIVAAGAVAIGLTMSVSAVAAPGNPAAGDRAGKKLARQNAKSTAGTGAGLAEGRRGDWQAPLLKAHPELDTDKDGRLGPEEMKAGRPTVEAFKREAMGKQVLAQHPGADTNGDGQLSEEEFKAFRQSRPGTAEGRPGPGQMIDWLIGHFDRADTDGNGQLSKDELLKLKEQARERGPASARLRAAKQSGEGTTDPKSTDNAAGATGTDDANVLAGPDHPKGEKKAKEAGKQRKAAKRKTADQPAEAPK